VGGGGVRESKAPLQTGLKKQSPPIKQDTTGSRAAREKEGRGQGGGGGGRKGPSKVAVSSKRLRDDSCFARGQAKTQREGDDRVILKKQALLLCDERLLGQSGFEKGGVEFMNEKGDVTAAEYGEASFVREAVADGRFQEKYPRGNKRKGSKRLRPGTNTRQG